jgi:hypothetical protein
VRASLSVSLCLSLLVRHGHADGCAVYSTIGFAAFFAFDVVVRLVALGPWVFFRTDGWNYLDVFVRLSCLSLSA